MRAANPSPLFSPSATPERKEKNSFFFCFAGIEVVKDIFKDAQSSCNYIKDIGPAVAGMAIFSSS